MSDPVTPKDELQPGAIAGFAVSASTDSFPASDFPAPKTWTQHRHCLTTGELDCVFLLGRIGQVLLPFVAHRTDLINRVLAKIALVAAIAAIRRRNETYFPSISSRISFAVISILRLTSALTRCSVFSSSIMQAALHSLLFAADLSKFSFTLNFTILLTRPRGIGLSKGNCTDPFAPL